ncbi:unnamed protein product [Caenorhabditis brenneri]
MTRKEANDWERPVLLPYLKIIWMNTLNSVRGSNENLLEIVQGGRETPSHPNCASVKEGEDVSKPTIVLNCCSSNHVNLSAIQLTTLTVVISHFNLNHLICTFWESNLTNLEVNQYLKHWKTGKFPKLRVAYFEMEDINLEVLLADLNAVEFPEGEERTFRNESNRDVTVNYGFDIRKENGTLATIVHQGGNLVSKKFFFGCLVSKQADWEHVLWHKCTMCSSTKISM